ncbi:MAG: SET domain-containing protein-lysine N-methyltransferase, partial [Anaerolineae bacterium]
PPARYLDVALSGAAPAPVRMSRLYLPADASPGLPADRLWPVTGVANIPPGLVAAELLNLLANPAYRPAAGVSLRTSGQTVEAHLHPPGPDGTPNPGATIQKHVRGRVFHVFMRPSVFGKTVCAAKDFQRGEPVIATNGREIDHQTEHSFQIGWNRHFEADFPARGINHSCQPTLGVKTNALGAPDFVAFTPIKAGQELTFDYAMTEFTHYPRQNPTLEFSLTCTCGAKTCRGKLGYYSELPPHIKKKYAGFISDYLTAAPQS